MLHFRPNKFLNANSYNTGQKEKKVKNCVERQMV